tara:strand:- start:823 stop:975 length:153 start_codon:yes stop_codon:yes gene_type:complete
MNADYSLQKSTHLILIYSKLADPHLAPCMGVREEPKGLAGVNGKFRQIEA